MSRPLGGLGSSLSAVSTTHPYPANSLAGGRGEAGLALRDPKEKPLGD